MTTTKQNFEFTFLTWIALFSGSQSPTLLPRDQRMTLLKTGAAELRLGYIRWSALILSVISFLPRTRKMKSVYHILNQFSLREGQRVLVGEGWLPTAEMARIRYAMQTKAKNCDSNIAGRHWPRGQKVLALPFRPLLRRYQRPRSTPPTTGTVRLEGSNQEERTLWCIGLTSTLLATRTLWILMGSTPIERWGWRKKLVV